MYILRNVSRLTPSLLKQSPYTFDVVWAKSNYMLIELNAKYPEQSEIPDYDLETVSYQTDGNEVFQVKQIQPYDKMEVLHNLRGKIQKHLKEEMFKGTDEFVFKNRSDPRYL
tara:strand:+ start:1380 stop:1715 length:336 start_codon:yes stop_codon:yes gene_type:complete